jgi:hypothetical protein
MKALIDCRADYSLLLALKEYGFEPILMPHASYLQTAIASHTDMLIFIGFERLFCHTLYYQSNKELIDSIAKYASLTVTVSEEQTGECYPYDVLFNACVVGNKLICNKKTVSKLLLGASFENNYEIIDVPQGYTKCSICVVSDNAIITADRSIAKACKHAGIDVLTVSEGHILLSPYDFGFIGGTSGLCKDKIYFCGSIETHPDAQKIKDFCKKHKKCAISLSDSALWDAGTLFFIQETVE